MQKGLDEFEKIHGQSKIKELEERLANERAKVEALVSKTRNITVSVTDDEVIRFGVTGDRHIGSLYHDSAALNAFYDYCKSRGVPVILDTGDITDGHRVYRGQEFELRDLGFEAQIKRVKEDSPKTIPTKFITGNHDASFKHLAGAEIGKQIQAAVSEYEFLGDTQSRYKWETPNGDFTCDLLHPGGGSAYAISYKPQKIVESLEGGSKPDMLAIGHFHKAECLPMYRNVFCLQTGTFQRQTPFMQRGGLQAHVGGWIVEVSIGKKTKTIKTEFVAFY
jgi:DNA polymerase II small subunit/DNA polymerase delta subunit B